MSQSIVSVIQTFAQRTGRRTSAKLVEVERPRRARQPQTRARSSSSARALTCLRPNGSKAARDRTSFRSSPSTRCSAGRLPSNGRASIRSAPPRPRGPSIARSMPIPCSTSSSCRGCATARARRARSRCSRARCAAQEGLRLGDRRDRARQRPDARDLALFDADLRSRHPDQRLCHLVGADRRRDLRADGRLRAAHRRAR